MKIGVVILSYNNHQDTLECVESFRKLVTQHEIQIIVVDNSTNEDYYALNKQIQGITLLRELTNNGYGHGNNVGLKYLQAKEVDYILVINNDTTVDSLFIDELINNFDSKDGMIAPIIYNYYEKTKIWANGGSYNAIIGRFKMNHDIAAQKTTSFISGCCFMIKKDALEKVGYFNENYFMYNEDGDYCYRFLKKGYKLKVVPSSVIYHKEGATSEKNSPFQLYYIYRNNYLFIYENFKGIKKAYYLLVNHFLLFLTWAKYKMRKQNNLFVFKEVFKNRKEKGRATKY